LRGVATFDKSGTGATSKLRNATLAPSCAYYAFAQLREAAVHALGSQILGMTYRIPSHTRVSLPIGVRTWAKSPFMCG
jgi:hypothetical protein